MPRGLSGSQVHFGEKRRWPLTPGTHPFPALGSLLRSLGEERAETYIAALLPLVSAPQATVNSWFSRRHLLVPLSQVTLPLGTCPSKAPCPHGDCHLSPRDCLPPVSQSGPRPSTASRLGAQYLQVPGVGVGVGSQPPPSWLLPPPGPRLRAQGWPMPVGWTAWTRCPATRAQVSRVSTHSHSDSGK